MILHSPRSRVRLRHLARGRSELCSFSFSCFSGFSSHAFSHPARCTISSSRRLSNKDMRTSSASSPLSSSKACIAHSAPKNSSVGCLTMAEASVYASRAFTVLQHIWYRDCDRVMPPWISGACPSTFSGALPPHEYRDVPTAAVAAALDVAAAAAAGGRWCRGGGIFRVPSGPVVVDVAGCTVVGPAAAAAVAAGNGPSTPAGGCCWCHACHCWHGESYLCRTEAGNVVQVSHPPSALT